MKQLKTLIAQHARLLALYIGSAVVLLWTLIRHITNGINFDVVGQIGLANQWAHGAHSGALLGSTNYILKMPLYTFVNGLSFISPINRILLLAALCNIATFVLLFIVFERVLRLYKVTDHLWLYVAMIWLATISGVVFWTDYANSRNLEVVGGLAIIYLTLKYLAKRERRSLLYLVAIATVTFFADPLQFYVCGLGICGYIFVRWLRNRNHQNRQDVLLVVGAIATSYVGSKLLFYVSKIVLQVSYLAVPNPRPSFTLGHVYGSVQGTTNSLFRIFDSDFIKLPIGPNSVREFLNFIVLSGIVFLAYSLYKKRPKHMQPLGLITSILAANVFIYMASGQALQLETSRYLVMIPLLTVLAVGLYAPSIVRFNQSRVRFGWVLVSFVSAVFLVGALVINLPSRHSKDTHIYQTVSYLTENKFVYALGSRETGVTTTYFARGQSVVLPLSCANHQVYGTDLFYDKSAFNGFRGYTGEVPIIMQANEIKFGSEHCLKADIITQFGQPLREQIVPGVGTALIYDGKAISLQIY